jgi:uncharacterized protein (TIGR02588 family)
MVDTRDKGGRRGEWRKGRGEDSPPFWEWFVAGLGALLVLLCMGYLAYRAVTGNSAAPMPDIRVVEVMRLDGVHLVRVKVYNRSESTAEGLRIAGLLERDGGIVERSQVVIQYLPGESWREAGLFFRRDPAEFDLRLVPEGYEAP